MLALRRTFNQQAQLILKFRSFSSEAADMDGSSESAAPKSKQKNNEGGKKKKNLEGVKSKQQDEIFQQFYDATEAALIFKPNYTAEEKADNFRIGKQYNIQSFRKHNKESQDFANKSWLQKEAIESMRPDLRANAMKVDRTKPPADRPWPHWDTPPIKGFKMQDYTKVAQTTSELDMKD